MYFSGQPNSTDQNLYEFDEASSSVQMLQLTITSQEASEFSLIDLKGAVLRQFKVQGSQQINLSALKSGMHLLVNKTTGNRQKIIKK